MSIFHRIILFIKNLMIRHYYVIKNLMMRRYYVVMYSFSGQQGSGFGSCAYSSDKSYFNEPWLRKHLLERHKSKGWDSLIVMNFRRVKKKEHLLWATDEQII